MRYDAPSSRLDRQDSPDVQAAGVDQQGNSLSARNASSIAATVAPASSSISSGRTNDVRVLHADLLTRLKYIYGVFTPGMFVLAGTLGPIIFAECVPNLPLPPILGMIFTFSCSQLLFGQNSNLVRVEYVYFAYVFVALCFILLLNEIFHVASSCGFFLYGFCTSNFLVSVAFALVLNFDPWQLGTWIVSSNRTRSCQLVVEWFAFFVWFLLCNVVLAVYVNCPVCMRESTKSGTNGLPQCSDCSGLYLLYVVYGVAIVIAGIIVKVDLLRAM